MLSEMFLSFPLSLFILLFSSYGLLAQSESNDVNADYSGADYDYHYDYDYDQFPEGAFECADGVKNISIHSRCDEESDCLDNSDESYCSPPSCPVDTFQCRDNSKCVSKKLLCDGIHHCNDQSDEFASQCGNCNATNLFSCQGSVEQVCLNVAFQCDGIVHCYDTADEVASLCR